MSWWEPDQDHAGWRGGLVRPAVLLVGALALASAALGLLIWAGSLLVAGFEMSGAGICPVNSAVAGVQPGDCLQVVALKSESGRVGHKTLTHVWQATPQNDGDDQTVDVSFMGSRRLGREKALGPVQGLLWHGDLVAFRGVDGNVVHTDDFGWAAGFEPLPWATFLAGLSLGAVASLVARRRAGVGWWSRRRVVLGPSRLTTVSWGLILLIA